MPVLRVAVLVLVAALAPAAAARAACNGETARSGTVTIQAGATARLFILKVPSAADGRTPSPVLFVFHPFGMNAQYMESRVSTRVWPEAIMVYPEGQSRGSGPSWQGRPGDLDDRDVAFFDAMLGWLDEHACIDRRRVFAMGYSNGAAFAGVLACTRAPALAGVALAAGRFVCQPGGPMPAIIGHGTRDQTVGYDQAMKNAQTWSTVNGCSAPPRFGTAGCFAATSCRSAPATLCTHEGGHEYSPGFTRSVADFLKDIDSRK